MLYKCWDSAKTFFRDLIRTAPVIIWLVVKILYNIRKRQISTLPLQSSFLIIVTNGIGDTITALPAIKSIRGRFPDAKIDCLAQPFVVPLLKQIEYIDDALPIYKAPFPSSLKKLFFNIFQIYRLRKKRYSTIIIFASNFCTAWIGFLTGAKKRCGFSKTEKVGLKTIKNFEFLLTDDYKGITGSTFVEAHLSLIKAIGLNVDYPIMPELPVTQLGFQKIERCLAACGIKEGNKIIVINPCALQATRIWPFDKYVSLINKLLQQKDLEIILTCGPEESGIIDSISKRLIKQVHNLSGKLDLNEFLALLKKANLFIGNDSGSMHIAYAVGTKTVAIFGPTDPKTRLLPNAPVKVVWNKTECSPCYDFGSYDRCYLGHHKCMRELSAEAVYEAVMEQLNLIKVS